MPIVDAGETYSWRLRVTDSSGAAGAPGSTPTIVVNLPDGTTGSAPTITANSGVGIGVYDVDWTSSTGLLGHHSWVASATGGVLGSTVKKFAGTFDVIDPTMMLVDTSEALAHLRAQSIIVTPDDWDQLRWLCMVASEAVEKDLHRYYMRKTRTEEYGCHQNPIYLRHRPVLSVTSITVDDGAITPDPSTWRLTTLGAVRARFGWLSSGWPGNVIITYVSGSTEVPLVVRKVALNTVQRMWQESQEAEHPIFEGNQKLALDTEVETGTLSSTEANAYAALRTMMVG